MIKNQIPSQKNWGKTNVDVNSFIKTTRLQEKQAGINTSGLLQRNTLMKDAQDQMQRLLAGESAEQLYKERMAKQQARYPSKNNSLFDQQTYEGEKYIADQVNNDLYQILTDFQGLKISKKPIIYNLSGDLIGVQKNGSKLLELYKEWYNKECTTPIPYVIYYGRLISKLHTFLIDPDNIVYTEKYQAITGYQNTSKQNPFSIASNLLSRHLQTKNPHFGNNTDCQQLTELIFVRHHRIRNNDKKFLKQLDALFEGKFSNEEFIKNILNPLLTKDNRSSISEEMLSFFTEQKNILHYFTLPSTDKEKRWDNLSEKISNYFSFVLTEGEKTRFQQLINKRDTNNIYIGLKAVLNRTNKFIRDTKELLENHIFSEQEKNAINQKNIPLEKRLYHCAELYANFHLRERLGYLYKKNTSTNDHLIPYAPINRHIDPTDDSVYDGIPYGPGLKPSE